MARISLIRHGQASFGQARYDELSATGKKQAGLLPAHFTQAGKAVPRVVYSGSMQRHRQTSAYGFPEATIEELPGLNEFNHEDVLRVHQPELFSRLKGQGASQEEIKSFVRTEFPLAIQKWSRDRTGSAYAESFPHLKIRCLAAFRHMLGTARREGQKEVVAITSGGFITLVMMEVLQVPEELFPEINLAIANASVTAFLFNDAKVSLAFFNNYSHLPEELLTFR